MFHITNMDHNNIIKAICINITFKEITKTFYNLRIIKSKHNLIEQYKLKYNVMKSFLDFIIRKKLIINIHYTSIKTLQKIN